MNKNKKFKIKTIKNQLKLYNNNNKINHLINFNYQATNSLNNKI